MELKVGDRIPDAQLSVMGSEGPEQISLSEAIAGRKVVLFALPGAYTGTCTTSHLPSFMRVMDSLKAKGVEDVYCLAVNDPFVLQAWSAATGAGDAGIKMLGDPAASLTKTIGAEFSVPALGLIDRSNRYAALIEDGVVKALSVDEAGVCDLSTGERFLEEI